jgi:hypothetical protein
VTCALDLRAHGYICAATNHLYQGHDVAGMSSSQEPPSPLARSAVVVIEFDLISSCVVFVCVHASHARKMRLHIILSITASSASTTLIPSIVQAIVLYKPFFSLPSPLFSFDHPVASFSLFLPPPFCPPPHDKTWQICLAARSCGAKALLEGLGMLAQPPLPCIKTLFPKPNLRAEDDAMGQWATLTSDSASSCTGCP